MQRTIKIRRYFPYPINRVWQAVTDPDILGKWFMANDFQPVIGHEFTFRMHPQKGWDCRGTHLLIEHAGYKGFKLALVSFIMGIGWKRQMKKLNAQLQKMNLEFS